MTNLADLADEGHFMRVEGRQGLRGL